MCIHDSSCGDFGSRVDVTYWRSVDDKEPLHCSYGSMYSWDEKNSDFSEVEHAVLLALVSSELGYSLLTKEEVDAYWKADEEEYWTAREAEYDERPE